MIQFRNGRKISENCKPYFIAEMNTSHFGNISVAKDMIAAAKNAGADCVKFQSWSADTLYSDEYYRENPIAKRFVNKFSLDDKDLKTLAQFSKEIGVDFSSTPYSIEEAIFLKEECEVPFIKIASMELNNHVFLKKLAQLRVPLVMSTGMGSFEEIQEAVAVLEQNEIENLVILHCTSIYPSDPKIINLRNILTLRNSFDRHAIGFSDHSEGISVPTAAIALGAVLIEKHFTLDRTQIGMDNGMATEPELFKEMILSCMAAYDSLGSTTRVLTDEEKEMAIKMRRSVVCKTDLKFGEVITYNNIEFKRPGSGICVNDHVKVIGNRINKPMRKGQLIRFQDLL